MTRFVWSAGAIIMAVVLSMPVACTETATLGRTKPAPQEDAAAPAPGEAPTSPVEESQEARDSGAPKISCSDTKTKAACDECCLAFNPAGQEFYHATSVEIVCREENCKEACASTYCASPPSNADTACKECWNGVLPRHADEFFKTCFGNDDCAAYATCLDESRCWGKPK